MKARVLLLLVLTACAAAPLAPDELEHSPTRWESSLVVVRYANCANEVEQAIEFWRAQGAMYLEGELVDADALHAELGSQPPSSIEMHFSGTAKTGGHGLETSETWGTGGDLARARTWLNTCYPKLIAHEMGHALGLGHTVDNRIMHPKVTDATRWEASWDEQAWVTPW